MPIGCATVLPKLRFASLSDGGLPRRQQVTALLDALQASPPDAPNTQAAKRAVATALAMAGTVHPGIWRPIDRACQLLEVPVPDALAMDEEKPAPPRLSARGTGSLRLLG